MSDTEDPVQAWTNRQREHRTFRGDPEAWTSNRKPGFRVLEESDDYIVIDKPAPLQVHPAKPGKPPTLLDELQDLLAYEIVNGARLSIINRLDRETSGVVLVAKTAGAASAFGRAMMKRRFQKEYLAVVWGWPQDDHFTVEAPILRQGEAGSTLVYLKQTVHIHGSPCLTDFCVLRRFQRAASPGEKFSLLRVRPHTGRMHQIRVHLAHAGYPVVGDKLYIDERNYLEFIETGWTNSLERRLLLNRQALHSHLLSIDDEEWGRRQWSAALPAEIVQFIEADDAKRS